LDYILSEMVCVYLQQRLRNWSQNLPNSVE